MSIALAHHGIIEISKLACKVQETAKEGTAWSGLRLDDGLLSR
jgi:hypothetical protein